MSLSTDRYSLGAIILHWLTAAVIIPLVVIGFQLENDGWTLSTKFQLYQWHKSLGITVFALTVLRVMWRLTHKAPPLPRTIKGYEKALARFTHFVFYALLLIIPLSGWVRVSIASFNIETVLYGLVTLPHIPALESLPVEIKKIWEPRTQTLHGTLAKAMLVLLFLHIAGAVKHQLGGNGVFHRMWPFFGPRRPSVIILGTCLTIVASGLCATPTQAAAWIIDPVKSDILFRIDVSGQKVKGRVENFSGMILFDPQKPESTEASVKLDLTSLTVGNSDGDAALRQKEWFHINAHPEGLFKAAKATKLVADSTYQLEGTLTLRGKSLPLTLPFSVEVRGRKAEAITTATINRNAFGIGTNADTGPLKVGENVIVEIRLFADLKDQ